MRRTTAALRKLLHDCTGLAPSEADLERALREHVPDAPAGFATRPGTPDFETLVDLVVVPESWMMRDPAVFAEALRFVQARLAARPARQLRILSLPCAGGEEPYSMALVLAQAGVPAARCRIDGIDLSQAAVARARAGRFTRNAFRGADLAFRARWFTPCGDDYLVADALREYVTFSQGNLLDPDGLPGGTRYDLVFCRNLLIYFDHAGSARAAHAIGALLADDGLLLSGYAEAPSFCRHGFAPAPQAGFALRKQAAGAPAPAPRPARAPLRVVPAAVPATAALPSTRPVPAPKLAPSLPPNVPPDLLAQARDHADAGRLADAEAACRAALAATPDSADAWFLLGMVEECGGKPKAADASWRRCVYLAPEHYEALCSLAMLHERLGDAAAGTGFRQRAARIFARRGSTAP
jgi:chemotaxis protein methyltransferase WspC